MILSLDEDEYALKVYQKLQQKGYKVMINMETDKLKKKLNYANKIGATKVILLGEEERKSCKRYANRSAREDYSSNVVNIRGAYSHFLV